ncbi:MAG: hypothetical protein ACYDGM_07360 [Vulcanimicrobiaceae bacterium]
MRAFGTVAFVTAAMVAAEIIVPGKAIYHSGWYNSLLVAFVVILGSLVRPALSGRSRLGRWGVACLASGVAVAGFAAVASGLLGPENHEVIGAPDSRVPAADFGGTLAFPPLNRDGTVAGDVLLLRGSQETAIGDWHYTGASILRLHPRSVIMVEAGPAGGGSLTITQPSGNTAFLSPVLLMKKTQTLPGMNLPFDTFALPAVHRIVRVVYFSSREVATERALGRAAFQSMTGAAVLFALEDETGQDLPGGFRLAASADPVIVGGLRLRGTVLKFPSVEIVAAPSFAAIVIAALLVAAGCFFLVRAMLAPDADRVVA